MQGFPLTACSAYHIIRASPVSRDAVAQRRPSWSGVRAHHRGATIRLCYHSTLLHRSQVSPCILS